MFHNSTTIWHSPRPEKNLSKEKRVAYGVILTSIQAAATTAWKVTGGAYRLGKKVTYPLRLPLKLAIGGVVKGAEYANKGFGYVELGARTGYEVGMGIGKDAIGGSVLELAKAPVMFAKRNLVDNTRDIIKGLVTTPVEFTKNVFTTPFRVLKKVVSAPFKFLGDPKETLSGMKNTIFSSVNSVRNSISKTVDNALDFKFGEIIKGTRNGIGKVLNIPYQMIKAPVVPLLRTPAKVAANIGLSVGEYPYRLYKSPSHWPKGYNRVMNSYSTAKAELMDPERRHMTNMASAIREKIRELREKAAAEKAERLASNSAKAAG